jgi:hypothetical protein
MTDLACQACGVTFRGDRLRKYCSRRCSQLGRRKDRGSCQKCGGPLTRRCQDKFCSRSCASSRPHTSAPRTKTCMACGAIFGRRYPSDLARRVTCSKACQGRAKREAFAERRLSMVMAKHGRLTLREMQLFKWGYKLGYQRRRQTELRRMERAA